MKKILSILFICVSITLLSAFTYKKLRPYNATVVKIESKPVQIIKIKAPTLKVKVELKNHEAFLDALGHQESGNRYHIVNKYGYMGRYQFGKETLKTIKIRVSRDIFLNNPDLQEQAMQRLLIYNKKKLKKYIEKYDGKIIHGILVTESGLLAAAHLGGQGSVKKWFRTGSIRRDGNGVKITSYMKRFGGYKLNL